MSNPSRERLATAWNLAAEGYEQYFAPWVHTAIDGLPESLVDGPVLVPCCGTFPELAPLHGALPGRELIGIDLSPGMIERAARRTAAVPHASALVGDAVDLTERWRGTAAAVVSVFGLQQLPDPTAAVTDWWQALAPGGYLSVVYWPPVTEESGPFALMHEVTSGGGQEPDGWPDELAVVLDRVGARVLVDEEVAHVIEHPDAAAFWDAVVTSGPRRSLAIATRRVRKIGRVAEEVRRPHWTRARQRPTP